MQHRRTQQQWEAIVSAFGRSRQSLADFCAERQLVPGTLRWWRSRLRETARPAAPSQDVQLVPVEVVGPPIPEPSISAVVLAVAGMELRVEVGTDVGYVAALVASLRARC